MDNAESLKTKKRYRDFKGKQVLLIFALSFLYFANYLCRQSLPANKINFMSEYGVSKPSVGLISMCFFFAYGAGQIINSIFIKKYNKRITLLVPVLIEAALVFTTFFKFDFEIYKFIWLATGICCSFLWMSIMKVLSENLDDKMLNVASVCLTTGISLGTILCYLLSSLFTQLGHFRLIFLVASIVILIACIFFFIISWFYRCSPKEDRSVEKEVQKYEKKNRPKFAYLLLAFFMMGAMVSNVGGESLNSWISPILKEGFGLSDSISILLSVILPIIHCLYPLTIVFLKKLGAKYQIIICFAMMFTAYCMSSALIRLNHHALALFLIFVAIGYIGFVMLNGIFTNLLPLEIRSYYDSGTFSGVMNGSAYIGSVIATFLIPLMIENLGWNSLFIVLVIVALLVSFGSFLVISIFGKKKEYSRYM